MANPQLLLVSFRHPVTNTSHWLSRTCLIVLALFTLVVSSSAHSDPSLLGQSGLVSMPDARIAEEGTLRFGVSRMKPYGALWSSISMFPRLELSARYTSTDNTTAFSGVPGANYGNDKDKAFDAKLILFRESQWLPQLSIGTQDFLGTRRYRANFVVASKRWGDMDFTLGTGTSRIDGVFGGIRYTPSFLKNWSLVSEYDAFNYARDYEAAQSGADKRKGGFTLGLNYHWGWLGAQLAWQDGVYGFNSYISIPLQQKEFIPKFDEPPVFTAKNTAKIERPTLQQWQDDARYPQGLVKALQAQDCKNVRLWLDGTTLELGLSQRRISLVARAVGRAVRTALLMSPVGTQRIKITYYTMTDIPVVSYEFTDLDKLDQFFSGHLTYGELLKVLKVSYVQPQFAQTLEHNRFQSPAGAVSDNNFKMRTEDEGQPVTVKRTSQTLDQFQILPINLSIFFNDPSGAFKYDLFARAKYRKYFGNAWFFDTTARVGLIENVSDVTQASNSTLPHVRTDVADYKREKGVKICCCVPVSMRAGRWDCMKKCSAAPVDKYYICPKTVTGPWTCRWIHSSNAM